MTSHTDMSAFNNTYRGVGRKSVGAKIGSGHFDEKTKQINMKKNSDGKKNNSLGNIVEDKLAQSKPYKKLNEEHS